MSIRKRPAGSSGGRDMTEKNDGYVFGLDIGTRSIVGTVGYRIGTERFVVVAQESVEHTTRAVIDGQIHDIFTVSKTIQEIKTRLENRIHQPLTDVCIAAAGRVLKTKQVHAVYEFPAETKGTDPLAGYVRGREGVRGNPEGRRGRGKTFLLCRLFYGKILSE